MSGSGVAGTLLSAELVGVLVLVFGPFHSAHQVCHWRDRGALPDAVCTPGALNPAVTQATIADTICKRGWTATIRPPLSWTAPRKRESMRDYGATGSTSDYEYDHLVSLELGGAPADTRNLWPEKHPGSFAKDTVENRLKRAVCAGAISLRRARSIIRTDWRRAS